MLVAMVTGTGKTFTMVNQVYRLMKSGSAAGYSSSSIAARWRRRRCASLPRSRRSRN
jgi:hypothetical protein